MRYKVILILSTLLFVCTQTFCQSYFSINPTTPGESYPKLSNRDALDSLIILRENGQKFKLMWPYNKNIKKLNEWEELLDDFQSDFKKIIKDLPVYNFCNINYLQRKNLVVNEVRGKEIYTVNEANGVDYVKSSTAVLKGSKLILILEFNEYEELLSPLIKEDFAAAISNVKHKFYLSSVNPERHYYSAKEGKLLAAPKSQIAFFTPIGTRLGLLKNQPYVEIRGGLGLMFDRRTYISLNLNGLTSYNSQEDVTQVDTYLSFVGGTIGPGIGMEFGFKVIDGNDDFDNLYFRTCFNYRTNTGIVLGIEYYLRNKVESENVDRFYGFNIGFGF